MGKKSKILILSVIILIIIIISIISIFKVYTAHIDKLYLVAENKIEENAKNCFLEGLCEGKEITLDYLISKGYISSQIDPVSKEYISKDLIIKFDGENCHTQIR